MLGNLHLSALYVPPVANPARLEIDAKAHGSARVHYKPGIERIERAFGKVERSAFAHIRPTRLGVAAASRIMGTFLKLERTPGKNIRPAMLGAHASLDRQRSV